MTTHTEDKTDTTTGGPRRLADAAGDVAEQATSVAEQRASSTMTQVGDTIEQVARAVRSTAEELRNDQPQIAKIADTAAERAEGAAQFLRQHGARDVLDEAQDFARRQPAVVVGAGLALGLLVGRAIKSAGPSGQRGSLRRAPVLGRRPGLLRGEQLSRHGLQRAVLGNRYVAAGSNGRSRGSALEHTDNPRRLSHPRHGATDTVADLSEARTRPGPATPTRSGDRWMPEGMNARSGDLSATQPAAEHARSQRDRLGADQVTSRARAATQDAALVGAGGALAYAGLLVLLAAVVLLLIDTGLEPWLAALLVAVVVMAIGAALAWRGREGLRTRTSPNEQSRRLRKTPNGRRSRSNDRRPDGGRGACRRDRRGGRGHRHRDRTDPRRDDRHGPGDRRSSGPGEHRPGREGDCARGDGRKG